jgi:hypothetical protein
MKFPHPSPVACWSTTRDFYMDTSLLSADSRPLKFDWKRVVSSLVHFTTIWHFRSPRSWINNHECWAGNDMEVTVACFENYSMTCMSWLLCYVTTLFQLQRLYSSERRGRVIMNCEEVRNYKETVVECLKVGTILAFETIKKYNFIILFFRILVPAVVFSACSPNPSYFIFLLEWQTKFHIHA